MMRGRKPVAAVVALGAVLVGCEARDVSSVNRPYEPVVLTGADVSGLEGIAPSRLVAFRFVYGSWSQVPVQVDERAVVDLAKPKNATPIGHTAPLYTDATTWTGADPDPTVDANDEIVFMSRESFGQARSIDDDDRNVHYDLVEPAHVVPGSGVEVRLADSLKSGSAGWMYLFESDGTLDPSAGRPPAVDYDFNLLSGAYKSTYDIGGGANPEDSTVTTPRYAAHFSDRWIQDELQVTAGGATGVDILDQHKAGFAGTCARSEGTFSTGGGAMIANKSGPVRAIRSYLGANSGTYTQRDHLMYESSMEVRTHLRVHAVPPLRDWIDHSAAASGMRHLSSVDTAGDVIDGAPDVVPAALPTWTMVRGAQGAVVQTSTIDTDIAGLTDKVIPYYSDDLTPAEEQCTGDAHQYGATGATVNQDVPNTDPTLADPRRFVSSRRMTMLEPSATIATAQGLGTQATTPLSVETAPFTP